MKDKYGIDYIPYETPLVQAIDMLLEFSKKKGSKTTCERAEDWEVMNKIIILWQTLYPEQAQSFHTFMKKWRSQSSRLGASREGEAMVQHQLEIPEKLHNLIKIIFPLQKWDKKFVRSFSQIYPGFKGSDSKL